MAAPGLCGDRVGDQVATDQTASPRLVPTLPPPLGCWHSTPCCPDAIRRVGDGSGSCSKTFSEREQDPCCETTVHACTKDWGHTCITIVQQQAGSQVPASTAAPRMLLHQLACREVHQRGVDPFWRCLGSHPKPPLLQVLLPPFLGRLHAGPLRLCRCPAQAPPEPHVQRAQHVGHAGQQRDTKQRRVQVGAPVGRVAPCPKE